MVLERNILVAFNGHRGAYADEVASILSPKAVSVGCASIEEVFQQVADRNAKYGVVPIENCIAGAVKDNHDLLFYYNINHGIKICKEVYYRINHCLLANKNATVRTVKRVYAHPQAFAQCIDFLKAHSYKQTQRNDNGTAAAFVHLRGRKDEAAIAGKTAAQLYRLNVLEEHIANCEYNMTRFLIIGRSNKPPKNGKVSVAFTCRHKPGGLHACINELRSINMTMIGSRPTGEKLGKYRFYIDLEGNTQDIYCALKKMKKHTASMACLGAYRTQAL